MFAAAFGQSWLAALRERFPPKSAPYAYDFARAESEFARSAREPFQAPTCCGILRAEPGAEEFAALVEAGRQDEKPAIYEREQFAQDVRGTEPAAGESEFQTNASLRSLLIGDQWNDSVLGVVCGSCLKKQIDDSRLAVERL